MSAMGELNFFLGLQVLQKEDGIFISKDKYVGDILKKFGYSDVKSSNTPMDKENPWGKDGTGKDVDLHLYRSMIGSLMYLTASRPDIMFVVCACSKHQVTPKECHLHAVKRIFRYLKGHPKLGLGYPKDSPFDLVAYSDIDYGGASQDRKSTSGGCQFLGRRLISWQCKEQTILCREFKALMRKKFQMNAMGELNLFLGLHVLQKEDGIFLSHDNGFIPTAGPPAIVTSTGSEVGPTASPIVIRRKGKEVMVESDTPKKKQLQEQIDAQVARELEEQQERKDIRMNEQIARDAEVARIHAEEEI
nr:hypothetical protein [Tanacetum cinerariifolium]